MPTHYSNSIERQVVECESIGNILQSPVQSSHILDQIQPSSSVAQQREPQLYDLKDLRLSQKCLLALKVVKFYRQHKHALNMDMQSSSVSHRDLQHSRSQKLSQVEQHIRLKFVQYQLLPQLNELFQSQIPLGEFGHRIMQLVITDDKNRQSVIALLQLLESFNANALKNWVQAVLPEFPAIHRNAVIDAIDQRPARHLIAATLKNFSNNEQAYLLQHLAQRPWQFVQRRCGRVLQQEINFGLQNIQLSWGRLHQSFLKQQSISENQLLELAEQYMDIIQAGAQRNAATPQEGVLTELNQLSNYRHKTTGQVTPIHEMATLSAWQGLVVKRDITARLSAFDRLLASLGVVPFAQHNTAAAAEPNADLSEWRGRFLLTQLKSQVISQPPPKTIISFLNPLLTAVLDLKPDTLINKANRAAQISIKQAIDGLWRCTADCIQASDLTITAEADLSTFYFMEDGSCTNQAGQLLSATDFEYQKLKATFNIDSQLIEKQAQSRLAMRSALSNNWHNIIHILSYVLQDTQAVDDFFAKAFLPSHMQEQIKGLLNVLVPPNMRNKRAVGLITATLQQLNSADIKHYIDALPDSGLDSLARRITDSIQQLSPYEHMPFFKDFADKLAIGLGENKAIQSVAKMLTKGYYAALPLFDKRQLMIKVLAQGGPPMQSTGELKPNALASLVSRMVQAGGPCFQKSMQLFKGDIPTQSLQQALEQVSSGIQPLAIHIITNIINHELTQLQWGDGVALQLLNDQHYLLEDNKPSAQQLQLGWPTQEEVRNFHLKKLGAATIAQTHAAYLVPSNNQANRPPQLVALKVQRPLIVDHIKREMQSMQRINSLPMYVRKTLSELENAILAETNFFREQHFAEILAPIYSKFSDATISLDVIKILGASTNLLVEEYSQGQSIPEIIQYNSQLKNTQAQAEFLNTAGHALGRLISGFTRASILGDPKQTFAIKLHAPNASQAKSLLKNNQLYVYQNNSDWFIEFIDRKNKNHKIQLNSTAVADITSVLAPYTKTKNLRSVNSLSLSDYAQLCNKLRTYSSYTLMFTGESFVDSDRHEGNLLYQRNTYAPDKLTCIDTGAGTIVSQLERKGMFLLATGVASSNINVVMDGISALIPDVNQLTSSDYTVFKQDLRECINRVQTQSEKCTEMYYYLLTHGLVDGTIEEADFFKDLLELPVDHPLPKQVFDFNQPNTSAAALSRYIQQQTGQNVQLEAVQSPLGQTYKEYIQKLNFERIVAVHPQSAFNPTHWITDGHNSLLFIKTIRKVANILEKHTIYAPECVIQVNRGTKFIEDQIRNINKHKAMVLQQISQDQTITAQNKQQIVRNLQPVHLGPAYVDGVLSWQLIHDGVQALGHKSFNAFGSLLNERGQATKRALNL